jgi:hypothetical protein
VSGQRECQACGETIAADARFCRHCGAAQAAPSPDPVEAPASGSDPAAERAAPGASEFAAALTAQLGTPAAIATLLAAGLGFIAVLAGGFVAAAASTGSSLIGGFDGGSLVDEWLLQACALVGAPYETAGAESFGIDISFQTMPALGVVIPVAAMALAVRHVQLPRLDGVAPGLRLGWAAAAATVFALLMLVPALTGELSSEGSSLKAAAGATFGLSLLWGLVGALIGARGEIGRVLADLGTRGERVRAFAAPPLAALRAFALALVVSAAVVLGAVLVQTFTEEAARGERPAGGAAFENSLYVVEHGVHGVQLGTLASFELPDILGFAFEDEEAFAEADGGPTAGLLMPLPAQSARAVVGDDPDSGYRIFDYSDSMHSYTFIPLLIVLIGIPVLLSLYAGFASARAARASSRGVAALWGALTGPVWALSMLVLTAITKGTDLISIFGHASSGSAFGWSLLVGTLGGAIGGLLASSGSERSAA